MNEDELRRILRQQRELERLAERLRGPLEPARQLQAKADRAGRLVGEFDELRGQLDRFFATADLVQRAFTASPGEGAAAAAVQKSEELNRALAAAIGPVRAVAQAERAQEVFLRSGLPSQNEIDRLTRLVRREWGKVAPSDEASYRALFTAAASVAEAVDAADEVVADDAEQTSARFLARAAALSRQARAALVKGLLEGALALLDAGQRLAGQPDAAAVALAAIEIAVAFAFIATVLSSFDDQ